MKKLIQSAMVLSITLCCMHAVAQTAGVYKNESDFITNKLSYPFDCGAGNGSIKLHSFFGSSKVDIKANGQKYSLSKSDVFGYRSCDGQSYRFYNNQAFEIIDIDGFYVYSQFAYAQGKGSTKMHTYYFSKNGSDIIEPLTVSNLDNVFAANAKFRYSIAGLSDSKLVEYDNYSSRYKIKYLYAESLKN